MSTFARPARGDYDGHTDLVHAVDRIPRDGRTGREIPGVGGIDDLGGGRVPRDPRDGNTGRPHHAVGHVGNVTAAIGTQDAR